MQIPLCFEIMRNSDKVSLKSVNQYEKRRFFEARIYPKVAVPRFDFGGLRVFLVVFGRSFFGDIISSFFSRDVFEVRILGLFWGKT